MVSEKKLKELERLYNYGFRDYAPVLGRFTTVDPIRDGGNWYAYCHNDPVNFIDPWGLVALDDDGNRIFKDNTTTTQNTTIELNLTLTTEEIGNIVFNETRSLSGEGIEEARVNVAHAIINADQKWGENRSTYAGSASTTANVPEAEQEVYQASQAAAANAVNQQQQGNDPTNGATNFNFRQNDSTSDFYGYPIQTQNGPFDNSYPTPELPASSIYANTYGNEPPDPTPTNINPPRDNTPKEAYINPCEGVSI